MTAARRMPLPGRLIGLLSALLLVLSVIAATPSRAAAANAPAEAAANWQIRLTSVTPAVASGATDVTIRGEVVNEGATSAPPPDVRLLGSFTPLVGRSAIAAWAAGRTEGVGIDLIDHHAHPRALAPGAGSAFTLTVSKPAQATTSAFGALPMLITAGADRLTTFVTIHNRVEYEPLDVSVVAPLTLDPDADLLASYGPDRLSSWGAQLSASSRHQRIVAGLRGLPVAFAVDPTLLSPPEAIADVRPTDAEAGLAWDRIPSEQREEVRLRREAATTLRASLGDSAVLVLPEADADLGSLLAEPQLVQDIAPALTLAADSAASIANGRSDILWPADGRLGQDRVQALIGAAGSHPVRAVVGAASSLSGENTAAAAHPGPDGSVVLSYDDRLAAGVLGLTEDLTGIRTRQRLLADSLALLAEFPGTRRGVLLALPRTLDTTPDALRVSVGALLDAPWVQATDLDTLIAQAPAGSGIPQQAPAELNLPNDIPTDPSLRRTALTPARVTLIQRGLNSLAGPAQIRADGPQYWDFWTWTERQVLSSRWRADRVALRPVIDAIRDAGTQARDAVAVQPGRINFFADSGQLQITIANSLDVPVENVVVRLRSLVPSFRIAADPEPVTIGAGARATVRVEATALAAATVPIRVSLYSRQGEHIGVDNTLQVRAYPTGSWFYWVIGGLAALLLVAGRWRTRRRRIRSSPTGASAS